MTVLDIAALLTGLELPAIPFEGAALWDATATIPLVLLARLVAVSVPVGLPWLGRSFTKGAVPGMTWCGLRGGISCPYGTARTSRSW